MKVKTISYAKVFPLAAYVNEKIGVEIELDDNDNYDKTFLTAKNLVEKFHKDNNPQLEYGEIIKFPQQPEPTPLKIIDYKAKENAEKQIDNATTLEDLDLLIADAAKYNLVSQFNEKKKQLSQ